MTYLWSGMIMIGIIYGALTGNFKAVTEATVSSGKDAVTLCISMAGIVAMWSGVMKIAENAGMVEKLSGKMRPVMRYLFPDLDPESKACKYISLNFLSNILGLGWAATPAGLKAMESLAELEHRPGTAGRAMCTFLIINISSLQLIPVNMIAYRAQYGSADPAAVVGPGIVATAVSTAVAVIFCRIMNRKGRAI
ncbi:MAG: nucleoside recognition protein [Blautia sp.]|uniref:nucleoside recognition protein n=1 Tax=Blautia sp. TaxID=1955243 RepID=UPI0025BA5B39|nr:nucleoside recognition protein [Blautia sp.]MCI7450341.1 nucleoside recognition protein [Blautia sp.]